MQSVDATRQVPSCQNLLPHMHRSCRQPLVPVISVEGGEWLLDAQLKPMMKPGGHGAIWKLMRDEGVSTRTGMRVHRLSDLVTKA